MRLIDADNFIKWVYEQKMTVEQEGMALGIAIHIDSLPIIEAIPISWIKERIKWCEVNNERKAAGIYDTLLLEWEEYNYLNKLKKERNNGQ